MPKIEIPSYFQAIVNPPGFTPAAARGKELDDVIEFAEDQLRLWAGLREVNVTIGDYTPWLKLVKTEDGSIERLEMIS